MSYRIGVIGAVLACVSDIAIDLLPYGRGHAWAVTVGNVAPFALLAGVAIAIHFLILEARRPRPPKSRLWFYRAPGRIGRGKRRDA